MINDYADKDFDGHAERTRLRPLAARRVTPGEALALAAGLRPYPSCWCCPQRPDDRPECRRSFWPEAIPLPRFLAIPRLIWYRLRLRHSDGLAALQGEVPLVAWVMLLANVFWAVAYDTEYAMVDRPDDLKIGIKTSAITFGRFDVAAVMACYALTLALLGWVGLRPGGALFCWGWRLPRPSWLTTTP